MMNDEVNTRAGAAWAGVNPAVRLEKVEHLTAKTNHRKSGAPVGTPFSPYNHFPNLMA